ncbi:MAG: MBL fold metallo-hydrolase [Candidatus Hodarchaeales archaeon]|jgi:glyoxylase-like metal-dependent hydrolase (beta-lactamase superfamily II)
MMKEVVGDLVWQGLGKGFDCNAFLIKGSQKTILVDSGTHGAAEQIEQFISNFQVSAIVLTHGHLDHVGGAAHAVQQINVPIWTSKFTAERLETADIGHIDPFFGMKIPAIEIERQVRDGDIVDLGDIAFEVLQTPGHTAGSICLYEPKRHWLFSGDTVFADGSFGRTDLVSGSSPQLIASLQKLASLPVEALFPGHMRSVLSNGSEHIAESHQIAKRWLS